MGHTPQVPEEAKRPQEVEELMSLFEKAHAITQVSPRLEEECSISSKRSQREIRVCFVGMGKAGKSTLINSLLGAPICPMDDVNETAIATVIMDTEERTKHRCFEGQIRRPYPNASHYIEITKVNPSQYSEGTNVNDAIRRNNADMRAGLQKQPTVYGAKIKKECLIVEAKLDKSWLNTAQELKDTKLVYIDTPGLNEDIIEEQLKDLIGYLNIFSDLIVYVANVTEAFSTTVMNQLRASIVHFKELSAMHIGQGFMLVLNRIDSVEDRVKTKKAWKDKLKSICEELKVNYHDFSSRVLFLSAKSLFLTNEIQRYTRERLQDNSPRIIRSNAEKAEKNGFLVGHGRGSKYNPATDDNK